MITPALRIPDVDWEGWLDAVAETTRLRSVELSASLLTEEAAACELVRHYGLAVAHVCHLLPPDVSRYLFETPPATRDDILKHLRHVLRQCTNTDASAVSIEVGLERIREPTFEDDVKARATLVHDLLGTPAGPGPTLCLHVRHPPSFPGSREWGHAANLIHETAEPRLRLALNLFLHELPHDTDVDRFVRSCCRQLAVVRFHYQPGLGEELAPRAQEEWGRSRRWHGFKGIVVFCPHLPGSEAIAEVCRKADDLAPIYAP